MGTTLAVAFLDALDRNQALRHEWQSVMLAALQEGMLRFAASHGHPTTAPDLAAALERRYYALSESDLAQVAGGLDPRREQPTPQLNLLRFLTFSTRP